MNDELLPESLSNFEKEINNLGRNVGVDVRLEVLLAELLRGGLDPRREVMIYPRGLFAREYRSDVGIGRILPVEPDKPGMPLSAKDVVFDKSGVWAGSIHAYENENPNINLPDHQEFLNIPVYRDGLYDYLPEGLFHQRTETDEREYAKEIAEQDRREQAARRFFRPIEQEFYLQGLLLELEERKYLITEDNLQQKEHGDILRGIWGLPADRLVRIPRPNGSGWTTTRDILLDFRQLNNLLHLLPVAHRLINNRNLVERLLALVLGVPVQLRTIPPLLILIETEPEDQIGPFELGQIELGNFSLAGIYQDTMPAVEIRLGPLNTAQLTDFLPEGRSRAVLDMLISYFLPAETENVIHLLVDEANQFLQLVEKESSPTSVLGWASYI
ncbi:hypothetical protein DYU11_09095 [Fibrisoma montanum]|uniref:Uncharacterized protein n=1 Tax=Fibrisoma montanum TaxID=2305895 RepID=A0A418MF73_9BACT|nr:type VI secretion system baseplate subunit TssG [Fibrisoma montanum]RIV25444.1 hypothetical protein DYU11_09095 [Fibrisoma montanum]